MWIVIDLKAHAAYGPFADLQAAFAWASMRWPVADFDVVRLGDPA